MRKYICTLPRLRPLVRFFCAASAVTMLCLPATSQDGRVNSRHAGAELHITATVMPVVIPPKDDRDKDRRRGRHDDTIAYNLSLAQGSLSITEETRSMLVEQNQAVVPTKVR